MDWHSILTQVFTPVLTALALVLVNYLLPKLPGATQHFFDWIKGHTASIKNDYTRGVLNSMIALAGQKVLALENTEIVYIKQQLAAGKITKDQLPTLLKGVKERAMAQIKADATATGVFKDATNVFMGNESALTTWLSDVVESQVAQLPSIGLGAPVTKTFDPTLDTPPGGSPVVPAAPSPTVAER